MPVEISIREHKHKTHMNQMKIYASHLSPNGFDVSSQDLVSSSDLDYCLTRLRNRTSRSPSNQKSTKTLSLPCSPHLHLRRQWSPPTRNRQKLLDTSFNNVDNFRAVLRQFFLLGRRRSTANHLSPFVTGIPTPKKGESELDLEQMRRDFPRQRIFEGQI